jgi:hypothetical protein
MDIFKELRFWRGLGKIFDTKIGSSISEASRKPINWMVSLAVCTKNDDIPWTPFNKPFSEGSLAIISTAGLYFEDDKPFDSDDNFQKKYTGIRIWAVGTILSCNGYFFTKTADTRYGMGIICAWGGKYTFNNLSD